MTQGRTDIHTPETKIQKLWELNFDQLRIPPYQRPYKWTVENVNQLINDLKNIHKSFNKTKPGQYRLGTLVLHKVQEKEQESGLVKETLNIVDGQQRIITLAILIYQLLSIQNPEHKDFYPRIEKFWKNTKISNPISESNILINASVIGRGLYEFEGGFLEFLLDHCEFVVISLSNIDEAFQFFDSQNSRGKELKPHDLLKAFHIREIKKIRELELRDEYKIAKWEKIRTADLHELFEYLYFLKTWLKGEKGEVFTKDRIQVFKGISLKKDLHPQNLPQIITHFFSTLPENETLREEFLDSLSKSMKIDKKKFLVALKKNENFSFQIDQRCINGDRFFDMVLHYYAILSEVQNPKDQNFIRKASDETSKKSAAQIIEFLNKYIKRKRTGDYYIRWLFNSLLLLYIDKFGWDEIDQAARKIFLWSYRIRIQEPSVFWDRTIQTSAIQSPLLKALRDAASSSDFLNCPIPIYEKDDPLSTNSTLFPFYQEVRDGQSK